MDFPLLSEFYVRGGVGLLYARKKLKTMYEKDHAVADLIDVSIRDICQYSNNVVLFTKS